MADLPLGFNRGLTRSKREVILRQRLKQTIGTVLKVHPARVIPQKIAIPLKGLGKRADVTVAYIDLVGSSALIEALQARTASRIVQGFLEMVARIVKDNDGEIRSFDGDRIMAVFVGWLKSRQAVRAALEIQWAMVNVFIPEIASTFPIVAAKGHSLRCVTGIDTSEIVAIKAGLRTDSDIVWLGRAANLAAKLSGFRATAKGTYISKATHSDLSVAPTFLVELPEIDWKQINFKFVGSEITILGTNAQCTLNRRVPVNRPLGRTLIS